MHELEKILTASVELQGREGLAFDKILSQVEADVIVGSCIVGYVAAAIDEQWQAVIAYNDKGDAGKQHAGAIAWLWTVVQGGTRFTPKVGQFMARVSPKRDFKQHDVAYYGCVGGSRSAERGAGAKPVSAGARTSIIALARKYRDAKDPGMYFGITVQGDTMKEVGLTIEKVIYAHSAGRRAAPKSAVAVKGDLATGMVSTCCHGMTQAILECSLSGYGTWPYEIAVGTRTNKLGACFGCATFMTANKFYPSMMHLGQAQSWVPLDEILGREGKRNEKEKETAEELNNAWREAVKKWMTTGARKLSVHVSNSHKPFLNILANGLRSASALEVANLFLDALAIHDKDIARLRRLSGKPSFEIQAAGLQTRRVTR